MHPAPFPPPPPGPAASGRDLLPALARLDRRLEAAVAALQAAQGPEAAADPYRGLYVSPAEAARLAARAPGAPAEYAAAPAAAPAADDGSRWAWLCRAAGLTALDAELLLVALAPEVEPRYERLYAYLQDDVTRRRPTVELALGLLCAGWEERVAGRGRLAPGAPLLRHRLLRLAEDPAHPDPPLLGRSLRPAARVVDFLLGSDLPDAALAGVCTPLEPAARLDELLLPGALGEALEAVVHGAAGGGTALVHLRGPYGVGKRTTAEALCRAAGVRLLVVDVDRLLAAGDAAARVGDLAREALLRGAALLWEGFDLLLADERRAVRAEVLRAAEGRGATFLAGEEAWEPADAPPGQAFYPVRLERPAYPERVRLWGALLNGDGAGEGVDVEALAGRFRLSGGQIRDAAATARTLARVRDPAEGRVSMDDLQAACRLRATPRLAALARRVEPRHGWDDLVLPPDRVQQLREIVLAMRHRARVYHAWGFDRALSLGKGVNVLFTGPPGTGKTMAAGVVAGALGLELYRIDLSALVSKYIGDTEKNLARVFDEAEAADAVLFFDEADALFGRRSEVRDSHDRYANLEVAYLLQRMDEYEGVVILATNLRRNLDDAFVRRMHHAVEFLLPGERERLRIWERVFPAAAPRAPGLALEQLARRLEVPGGSIRNIALAAAFLAADGDGVIRMEHLACAARRELQKIGKALSDREVEELAALG
ncbi:MAG: AAA family ATPase [Longimicrobiaceae bacterium]